MSPTAMRGSDAAKLFGAFALSYFLSALLRSIAATLAPQFSDEFGLSASDLGLLAGAYFLGFSMLQLPLGSALDRVGPRRVLLALLSLAVLGCVAFSLASSLWGLVAARALTGMGVAAGLMAALTAFRSRFDAPTQLRLNSWMLMTGSMGMLTSTLPVQWLLPLWGWRGLFAVIAVALVLAMAVIARWVPRDAPAPESAATGFGYSGIFSHPLFIRSMPLGFFVYGGMIAVQTLWAGPWLTRVAGQSPQQAAGGLFLINACMLLAFLVWGVVMPHLSRRGYTARALMAAGLPLSFVLMAWNVASPEPVGAVAWAAWCVSCTFINLSQPAIGQAFDSARAGRALSAFNLVIFLGVFCLQWLIGVGIDWARSLGLSEPEAFRWALGCFGLACVLSYLWYLWPPRRWQGAQ